MILTDVYVTAWNETCECKLDENRYIWEILEELGHMFFQGLTDNDRKEGGALLLCSPEESRILPADSTLRREGIRTGSRLMLI